MKIGEFEIIQNFLRLTKIKSRKIIRGIGDDCAVVSGRPGYYFLLTTDSQVEGTHFNFKYCTPHQVGRRAMAVNLSDVAAMGGDPLYALVSFGVPSTLSSSWLMQCYQGLNDTAKRYHCDIVGGNISHSPHFWVSISLVGEVKKNHCKFRNGANVGDLIYVTGNLGSSAMGLKILKGTKKGSRDFIKAHMEPEPRLKMGAFLGRQRAVTSMIDISDGLLGDLNHIMDESHVGAKIEMDKIPHHPDLKGAFTDLVLNGGEDYELLFTVKPESKKYFNKFYRIGEIVDYKQGLKVVDGKGKLMRISQKGYTHF